MLVARAYNMFFRLNWWDNCYDVKSMNNTLVSLAHS